MESLSLIMHIYNVLWYDLASFKLYADYDVCLGGCLGTSYVVYNSLRF